MFGRSSAASAAASSPFAASPTSSVSGSAPVWRASHSGRPGNQRARAWPQGQKGRVRAGWGRPGALHDLCRVFTGGKPSRSKLILASAIASASGRMKGSRRPVRAEGRGLRGGGRMNGGQGNGVRWGSVALGWLVAATAGATIRPPLGALYGSLAALPAGTEEPNATAVVLALVSGFLSYLLGGFTAAKVLRPLGGSQRGHNGGLRAGLGLGGERRSGPVRRGLRLGPGRTARELRSRRGGTRGRPAALPLGPVRGLRRWGARRADPAGASASWLACYRPLTPVGGNPLARSRRSV